MNTAYERPPVIRIADADRTALFAEGLEYNTPARGMWNIVHTGMLIPGAHQVYACAQGCLRGVILTAAEMNALDRMSWIAVSEQDLFDGTLEQSIIDGTAKIIGRLPVRPKVILLYLSCIHLFAGVDFSEILAQLSERFPDIHFTDCYMTPTMRKTVSPAVKMAEQLYDALRPLPVNAKSVNLIGNDRPTQLDSELLRILRENGFTVRDLTTCKTHADYLQMAESALNLTYLPVGKRAGETLAKRLGTKHLHLPVSYNYDDIAANYRVLCEALGIPCPDFSADIAAAEAALDTARRVIGQTPVVIDYTAVPYPFSLAEMLLAHGFSVRCVIADSAAGEESAFDRLAAQYPDLEICQAVNVNMLHAHESALGEALCIGQKAAYYFASDRFVNIVMNGGFYGFAGIRALAEAMTDAYRNPKDRRTVLRHKGIGCPSCINSECGMNAAANPVGE